MPLLPAVTSARECNIANALEIVGDRWSLLVVRELFYAQRRFTDIARGTGAPKDILATRLRKLEDAGVIVRTAYSEHPPRFEYHLTKAGGALAPVLLSLKRWGDEHLPGSAPVDFVHTCGEVFVAEMHCAACGTATDGRDLTLRGA